MEVPCLKDNCQAKVLECIHLVILMAALRRFGYPFEPLMVNLLPETHSDTKTLDSYDEGNLKNFKAVQANNNAIA